jgi:hypothetical protein
MAKKSEQIREWNGAFAAFGRGLEQIKANPKPALLYLGIYLIIYTLELFAPAPGAKGSLVRIGSYEGLAYFIFLLALPTYALAVADKKQLSLSRFMQFNARKYFSAFGASLLYGLIVLGSALLLIVPAIWTIAWFSLCVLLVVDKNLGPIQALKASKELIQHHKAKVWGILGATLLLTFGSMIVLLIPYVGTVASPLLSCGIALLSATATAMLYRWAEQQKS